MKRKRLFAGLIAVIALHPFVLNAADVQRVECLTHMRHVRSHILEPQIAGESKQEVLKRIDIIAAAGNAREKRMLQEIARITYTYEVDPVALLSWARLNCNKSRQTNADFALPWKRYGNVVTACTMAATSARDAAEKRDRGVTYAQFMAKYKNAYAKELANPDPDVETFDLMVTIGSGYAYGDGKSRPPQDAALEAFDLCFEIIVEGK